MRKLGLDLGCGQVKKASSKETTWVGMDTPNYKDLYPAEEYVIGDMLKEYPFQDSLFDIIWCHHVLEHIPHQLPNGKDALIFTTDEMYRVLKPGGEAHLIVPWKEHTNAWRHPCHYRFFDKNLFGWFSQSNPTPDHKTYGLKAKWKITRNQVVDECHVYAILVAMK